MAARAQVCGLAIGLLLALAGCTIERKVSKPTYSHMPHGVQRKVVGGESISPGRKVEERKDPVFD